ncbi:MAG: DNA mismatch repair protein MutS [Eubacterium sp.]|nr:DNA mismatch repair protein MutS [Eubacterium sp.]
MMQHYLKTREEVGEPILFYRLGDFYEMFFEDAQLVARELELTLTGKDCGLPERAPMCGIPYHAADTYINRLIEKGYKVAICEQVEDPKLAKGLVERKVVRIVTPGTNIADQSLEEGRNHFLFCLSESRGRFGLAITDISTGVFLCTRVDTWNKVLDEIIKYEPSELLLPTRLLPPKGEVVFTADSLSAEELYRLEEITDKQHTARTALPESDYEAGSAREAVLRQFHVMSVEGLGLRDYPEIVSASGALLHYIQDTQMTELSQINTLQLYFTDQYMVLDSSTRRNLELCETLRDKQKKGSLLWVLDHTRTAMGARKLRAWVEQPLRDRRAILERQDGISALSEQLVVRDEMREYLNAIYDLERLMTRISLRSASPRDLLAFKQSLGYLPYIHNLLKELPEKEIFREMLEHYDDLSDVWQLLEAAIDPDAPITVKEGGIFRPGYSAEIDDLKNKKGNSKQLLDELEEKEREATGIRNLRIKYNKVFGYYLEVTNSFKNMVPDYFIRKQTLTNAERYTTDELNRLSDVILNAEDRLFALEYALYAELRDKLALEVERVQHMADVIARLDALCSLSVAAVRFHYVRPNINEEQYISIKNGRHPVVERMLANDSFIPNDTLLNLSDGRIAIITGPNMAGKSTYMRQVALIALMAQIGSFVPADAADICISDRIFTRVGASDDLAQGQSTFMVEMSEVASILRNATRDSLIILDEIGRGTSTFDGLSIAWAVVEYIADTGKLGAKTLFATHYHELSELEGKLAGVQNFCIAIKQTGNGIAFLRKIIPGGADRSYGIEVAELAGVPVAVTNRARTIAQLLAEEDLTGNIRYLTVQSGENTAAATEAAMVPASENSKAKETPGGKKRMTAAEQKVLDSLREMEVNDMTPIAALLTLLQLKETLS